MRAREKESYLLQELLKDHAGSKPRELICSGGEIALVDEEDYPVAVRHSWVYTKGQKRPYVVTTLNATEGSKKTIMLHNLLLGFSRYLDHIDGNTLNNCKSNLRPATVQENGWNKGKPKGGRFGQFNSQYKGVSKHVGRAGNVYWRVIIKLSKKGEVPARFARLGPFDTEIEAARAYNEEVVKHRGKFAWVNPLPD